MEKPRLVKPKLSDTAETVCAAARTDEIAKYKLPAPLCGGCPFFGKRWACPPLDSNAGADFAKSRYANLAAVKIKPIQSEASAEEIIEDARKFFDEIFYLLEKSLPNSILMLAGSCLCPAARSCPRGRNEPCLRPDKMRLSLEAAGFDVVKMANDFLHTNILWEKNGERPKYFTLVYCIFADANAEEEITRTLAAYIANTAK